jgi:hypothetical protein
MENLLPRSENRTELSVITCCRPQTEHKCIETKQSHKSIDYHPAIQRRTCRICQKKICLVELSNGWGAWMEPRDGSNQRKPSSPLPMNGFLYLWTSLDILIGQYGSLEHDWDSGIPRGCGISPSLGITGGCASGLEPVQMGPSGVGGPINWLGFGEVERALSQKGVRLCKGDW